MSVAVVKLGVGNTASVMFALERLGASAVLTDDATAVAAAERVILPGVGAAAHAMAKLREKGLGPILRSFTRPLLGICLGQQLLFERSEEGGADALGLIAGEVTQLQRASDLPSPHMGWSSTALLKEHALFAGIPDGSYFYFVHSYACPLGQAALARASYGRAFAAAVAQGNVMGVQFHPERSGALGARLLQNFMALPC